MLASQVELTQAVWLWLLGICSALTFIAGLVLGIRIKPIVQEAGDEYRREVAELQAEKDAAAADRA